MAIVMEYTTPAGVKVFFHDDAYVNCTEEELARRAKHIRETAYRCAVRAAERRAAREAAAAGKGREDEPT